MKKIYTLIIGTCLMASSNTNAQDGTLDGSFNGTGMFKTNFGATAGNAGYGRTVAIQSDGKVVVGGRSQDGSGNNDNFTLVRLNTNGTYDNAFGASGIVTTDFTNGIDYGMSVAIQSDGKIVLGGMNQALGDYELARYNTNGTLDNTFGTGGKVTTNMGGADNGYSMVIQSDGKILLGGSNGSDFAVARYNTNGSLDNTFGTTGKIITPVGTGTDIGRSLALQSDGKIVLAGYSMNAAATDYDYSLVRYNTNGTLDNTFGTGGKVTTDFSSANNYCFSVAIQSDGKIVLGGYTIISNRDFTLARYTTTGGLDNTFGTGGKVTTVFGSADDVIYSLALQLDGKILAAGYSNNGTSDDFALARYNTNGVLDNTFGGANGKVTTDFGADDQGWSVAIQGDGKIVVAGHIVNNSNSTIEFAVARYYSACLIPAAPGTITGATPVCSGTSNTYTIATVTGATSYTWTVPGGWTGTSTTNSITTTASATSGNITVKSGNTCGTSTAQTKAITVKTVPATPTTINGAAAICDGTTNTYNASAVTGATSYVWTLPGGWSGTSTTTVISATSNTVSGNITVAASNTCGVGTAQTKSVTVNICSGINETDLSNIVSVYPNPFNSKINIVTTSKNVACIQLFNALGALHYSSEIKESKTEIDLSNQKPGIYFLKITNENGSVTKKLIKE